MCVFVVCCSGFGGGGKGSGKAKTTVKRAFSRWLSVTLNCHRLQSFYMKKSFISKSVSKSR